MKKEEVVKSTVPKEIARREVEEMWIAIAEQRLKGILDGTRPTEPAEVVLRRARENLIKMKTLISLFLLLGFVAAELAHAQPVRVSSAFKIARLKYAGGGDWYNDQSAEVNLLRFVRDNTAINVEPTYEFVDVNSEQLFTYPFIFLTGHGNVVFNENEVKRLRTYLENGGFLYADDDYGMDKAFRREMKKIFPAQDLVELPFSHPIYRAPFDFSNGPPKTHEHDKKPPQGYGLFHNGRLVVYYTAESNPSDGWADADVHNDPPEKRQEALRFGANIIVYALTN